MSVNKNDVYYVAALARLKFSHEECIAFEKDLNEILMYFQKLNEIDTEGIPPTAHAIDLKNRFRDDEVKPSIDRKLALINASSVKDGCFKVPKIIE